MEKLRFQFDFFFLILNSIFMERYSLCHLSAKANLNFNGFHETNQNCSVWQKSEDEIKFELLSSSAGDFFFF